MKLKQLTKCSSASLALLGLSMGTAQGAIMSWVAGADGAWETGANWQTNDTIPVNRVPTTGDDVRPGTGGHLVTYSSASGTSTIGRFTQFGANPNVVSQTGGDLSITTASGGAGLMYLASNAGTSSLPNYSISGGTLAVQRALNMSWNNGNNYTSTMLQTSGDVSFGEEIKMALKANGQSATYDLQGGTLTARGINMGDGGNTYTTLFDQTGGAATIANQLALGKNTTKTGSSIYNLHGGSLTIENSTNPFLFTTDGASTAYLDFLGSGTLNLKGTWDFASLTAIANSDFRVAGAPVADGDLLFEPVTIDTESYTQITISTALQLIITSNGTDLTFTWKSKDGKVYDLLSASDLSTTPDTWTPWQSDIPATPDTNMETYPGAVTSLGTSTFFVLVEKNAPPPPLQNGSFEDPVTADGQFTTEAPPSWTEFDAGNLGDVGVWNPTVAEHATVPDGENVGQLFHTGVPMTAFGLSQVLGESFAVDTNYEVTVQVGRSTAYAWPGYRVELWAGATKIAEESNTLVPAADSWTPSVVSYTYSGGDAGLAGEPLEVRLLSLGEDQEGAGAGADFSVEFDNLTFTATGP